VRGSVALAFRLGVAPVLIGLTVVAFGTSSPELVVTLVAAFRGSSDIGFGNVVGSNIANVGLLLATAALVAPLAVHRTLVVREIPMMILACVAVIVLGAGPLRGGGVPGYGRGDGLMLLLLFGVFLYYTISEALHDRGGTPGQSDGAADAEGPSGTLPAEHERMAKILVLTVGGLLLLVAGGELTVRGAIRIATDLGVSEAVVGLTVVAVGTSLPELATSITAARRGESDIAVGTIVGSNLFNLLFVFGVSVTVAPAAMPRGGPIDLLVMTGLSALLLPMVLTKRRVDRREGGVLLAMYLGYMMWLFLR
jgi:cation:H+ antiporter